MKAAKPPALVPVEATRLKVLLVEDSDSDASVARAAVEKALRGPHDILRAANLSHGLALLRGVGVDLVLLDLNLPDSNGINTLKRMCLATTVPIIVITNEDRPGLDEEALGSGAFEILHKGRLGPDTITRLLRLAEDRRRSQGSLEDAEQRFRSLTALSADWYWEQDKDLRFSYYSPGFAERSGARPEKLIGTHRWDEPGRTPLRGTWEEHRALLEARQSFRNLEFVRVNADGTRAYQSVNGEPFYDAAGKFAGYRGTSRDITERKLAEVALREQTERLRIGQSVAGMITLDWDIPNDRITWSGSPEWLLGPMPLSGEYPQYMDQVHPADRARFLVERAQDIKSLEGRTNQYRFIRTDGKVLWLQARKAVFADASGKAARMLVALHDITERKHAEQALERERMRLELALAASRMCTWDYDLPSGEVVLSESWAEMIGAPRGETRTSIKAMVTFVHPADIAALRRDLTDVVKGQRAEYSVEHRVRHTSGEWLWIVSRGRVTERDAQGRAVRAIGSNLDISERKRAEHALAVSERRFRDFAESGLDWFWETDAEGRYIWFSDSVERIGGAKPEWHYGKKRTDLAARGDDLNAEPWKSHLAQLARHEPFRDFRYERAGPNSSNWLSVSGVPYFDDAGRFAGYRGSGTDITAAVEAERKANAAHAYLRSALEDLGEMICLTDAEDRIVFANRRFVEINADVAELVAPGRRFDEHLRAGIALGLIPEGVGRAEEWIAERMAQRHAAHRLEERRRQDGRWILLGDHSLPGGGVITFGVEVTERKRTEEALRESEARFRSLTELSSDWYWEQDAELRYTYLSPGYGEHLHGDPAKVMGRRRWELDHVMPAFGPWAEHRSVVEARLPFRDFEQIRVSRSGTRQVISSSGSPVFDASGAFTGYHGVSSDITQRKDAEKRLAYLSQYDDVTGLPNRELLQEKLELAVVQSRRRNRGAGVLFVNLDRFKLVNDSLGREVGDELLSQVGKGLGGCVRQDDSVGRLAGDEFAVVIADLARPDDAAIVAQKIVSSFAAPFNLDGQEIYLTASIGIAAYPGDGEDGDTLLTCADAAMNRAKASSPNSFCFYTAEMNARAAATLQLNNDLRRAVERNEFRLHYQPKVNLATGALTGMEALLRWQHPERGMVSPLDFIPALEDTGLIVAVGDWVVEEACRQLRDWTREGLEPVPIAVNLSARQFRRSDLDSAIRASVEAHGLPAGLLELEITESSLMVNAADAIRQLQTLRAAGLKISVDDFGTGYSSLAYLTRLPLSTLKIDRAFVNAATTDRNSAAIVRMVIDMAQNLRLNVVAEGIETVEQIEFLRQHGCAEGQGYHIGRPAPAAQVATRLSSRA